MKEHKTKKTLPRIALITNHGYAGVEIPVGGAPDTGGQNFYVNSLALALEEIGYEVTIFARGGFPFFGSNRRREGTEKLSEKVRYVYVPGGGFSFIHKEDIAIALDEEIAWLHNFIADEAKQEGVDAWDFYEIVNTHYWDAAIMAVKLVELWRNSIAYDFLNTVNKGVFAAGLKKFEGKLKHRQSLAREILLHTAEIAHNVFPDLNAKQIAAKVSPDTPYPKDDKTLNDEQDLTCQIVFGKHLAHTLKIGKKTIFEHMDRADTHVWTPHSLGIIKERNFWDKDEKTQRALKFRERDSHEQVVCKRTRLFCSTSKEISRALVVYHDVEPKCVFDFPPCLDTTLFKPRSKDELKEVYTYLSNLSGIPKETLREGQILFETSRMDHTKRKDILLRAFADVAKQRENVFLFIGGGPTGSPVFKELEMLKSKLPALTGRGFLLGFVPDDILAPLFSVPDIFVSASEMEGFGMSVSQAAAARVAVISSDLIPFATQFAKEAAVVVKAGDVRGFADAMTMLLDDENERTKRAAELLAVAEKLNWKDTAKRFVDWYEKSST